MSAGEVFSGACVNMFVVDGMVNYRLQVSIFEMSHHILQTQSIHALGSGGSGNISFCTHLLFTRSLVVRIMLNALC